MPVYWLAMWLFEMAHKGRIVPYPPNDRMSC